MGIESVNPLNGKVTKKFRPLSSKELSVKIQRSANAFAKYKLTRIEERTELLTSLADLLERRAEKLARIITLEMGKPILASKEEILKCAANCRFFADNAPMYLGPKMVKGMNTRGPQKSFIRFDPLGPIAAVMPWNFPFWQVFRFAAPALAAGNSILMKHASNVPECSITIERIFREAGFPRDIFQSLLITSQQVEDLIASPCVAAVTLTGSVGAGRIIGALSGKYLKKSVMELGGSDPFIVMPSANLDAAVKAGVKAKIVNSGQSCIAAKRFIIHKSIFSEFESKFLAAMARLKIGNPLHTNIDVGPLATESILTDLVKQVRTSVRLGAKIILGGQRAAREGFFYLPTILTNIPKDSPAYKEELFGPVASLFMAANLKDALEIANDTDFGLGASFWSQNENEHQYFVKHIDAGNAYINGQVVSNPALPFGGIKQSGYGRELGRFGIREFVNIKTVCIS